MNTNAGRAFEIVRTAIEHSGATTRPRGERGLMASCPLHPDTNPSLSVTWKPRADAGGAVLLYCFSCRADAATIAAAFGLSMAELFDDTAHPNPRRATHPPASVARQPQPRHAHRWLRVTVYTYTTATGTPVQQVLRDECHCDGTTQKRFLQRYRVGRQWVWRKPDSFTPVLYRAPALAAADPSQWVWLTEGEKDADTAAALGRLATTNAQGAQSFPPALAEPLAGRNVAIIIDRDRAGYQRGLDLHDVLHERARRCVLLLPASTEAKADLTDHVRAGLWDPTDDFGGLLQVTRDQLEGLHRTAG